MNVSSITIKIMLWSLYFIPLYAICFSKTLIQNSEVSNHAYIMGLIWICKYMYSFTCIGKNLQKSRFYIGLPFYSFHKNKNLGDNEAMYVCNQNTVFLWRSTQPLVQSAHSHCRLSHSAEAIGRAGSLSCHRLNCGAGAELTLPRGASELGSRSAYHLASTAFTLVE